MVVVIISSTEDPASINIKNSILKKCDWDEVDILENNVIYQHSQMKDVFLVTIDNLTITHDNLDNEINLKLGLKPSQVIYISRHSSKTGAPTLTTHPIGNYSDALFGGRKKTLCPSSPKIMTEYLRILKKNAKDAKLYHKVCFEVTHHGPFINTPTFYAEVGSTMDEWKKQKPANIVAKSILDLLDNYHYESDFSDDIPVLIGIGGGHYAPRFTDIIFEKKVAFGHMIPSYHINSNIFNYEIFEKALEKTPNAIGVYIHKKSLKKSQVSDFKKWFENKNIQVISSKDLFKID